MTILIEIICVGLLVSCTMVLGFYWIMKRLGLWPIDRISTQTGAGTTITSWEIK